MGIKVEFNPDLCLRNISEYRKGNRKPEECIPEQLEVGKIYEFLKSEQRLYWLGGELPLRETKGGENLSKPKASVKILEFTLFKEKDLIFTKGKYEIVKILDDDDVYFEGYELINKNSGFLPAQE